MRRLHIRPLRPRLCACWAGPVPGRRPPITARFQHCFGSLSKFYRNLRAGWEGPCQWYFPDTQQRIQSKSIKPGLWWEHRQLKLWLKLACCYSGSTKWWSRETLKNQVWRDPTKHHGVPNTSDCGGPTVSLRVFLFVCVSVCARAHAKLLQLCLTFCDPMNCSPTGSSVHGILQAFSRILHSMEWAAIPFTRGSSWLRDTTCIPYVSWIGRPVLYQ